MWTEACFLLLRQFKIVGAEIQYVRTFAGIPRVCAWLLILPGKFARNEAQRVA